MMNPALRLNGEWVGEGAAPSPASWQLHVQGLRATLVHFNGLAAQHITRFECTLAGTPAAFTFGEPCEEFIGLALDDLHVVIAGLDEGNDVIFSRPGLAELSMHEAYAGALDKSALPRFALTRWAAA